MANFCYFAPPFNTKAIQFYVKKMRRSYYTNNQVAAPSLGGEKVKHTGGALGG